MSMKTSLPNYAGLFGNIDFKKGDEARSVYSPAAYLTDLLQMLDDEFDAKTIDFHQRRGDIKSIDLDEENTNTLIPYLDVANEVLEGRTGKGADALYDETLPAAKYPFNMPFSFNNEKRKNHLGHLGISARELRHLFATETDYATVAREYLGLSTEELAAFVEPTESIADADLEAAYGYTGESFVSDMSNVSTFMEQTDLEAEAVRELIYQKLYIEPSDHSVVEDGREHFYINKGLSDNVESAYYSGCVTLNTAETEFEWKSLSDTASTDTTLPPEWFDRASRFIRFAQKTGLAFTELDHILRHCCEVNGSPAIDNDTLLSIAQVVYLHKTFARPIDAIVAVLSTISYTGRANEDYPADQFNRVFNSPCVKVDEKYLHIDGKTGEAPEQYTDTTYHDYTRIQYYADLFSDDNDDYRKRLRHTLGFTETDLINITERLEYEEVATSDLWEKTENEWALLNILYRVHALSGALEAHFLDLFTMFDLLEQDPFIGRMDPHTYFIYRTPSTQKCFEILVGNSVGDRLWLFESLAALNKWMKQFGYSAEMLWNIVNAAPLTDKAQALRKKQDLTLYNALLEGFKGRELTPETFQEALGDERAARLAYALFQGPFGHRQENRDYPHGCGERGKPWQEPMRQLVKHTPRTHDELAEEFIGQLSYITEEEFIGLSLEDKLQEKILANLVIHEVIDGDGNILAKSIVDVDDDGDANDDGYAADPSPFRLEYDFSGIRDRVFALFHEIYEKDSEGTDDPDDIEVQIFKSDLKALGLEEPEARELYDTLIHNGIIDDQGYARDVHRFGDPDGADSLELGAGLWAVEQDVQDYLNTQVAKFEASRIVFGEQRFEALGLKPVELDDLMTNLRMNRYLDEDNALVDKLRILDETPDTMELAWEFYPHRAAIFQVLQDAIAEDKETYLKMDQDTLGEIAARAVSHWVYEDLQGAYLRGHRLQSEAGAFFLAEENRADFMLRGYFDTARTDVVFDHVKGIVKYAKSYRLTDEALAALDFDEQEIDGLKAALREADVLNDDDTLRADRAPFFLAPKNVNDFTVPDFEDYDKEVFFQLHGVAKAIDGAVRSIDEAMRQQSQLQETAILDQLQGVLGIDPAAVKMLSQAIFKTEDNLHFAWLAPLLESANALNRLDELPANMQYTQAVKRIRQLALLVKKLQLSNNELAIALEDQALVAKFPEDIILPDRIRSVDGVTSVETITSVDAILEGGEFVYFFKDDYYWIFLASDYTLIDRKEVVAGRTDDDDDLIDRQKEDEARQKRLKEDPIRQLFDKEDIEKVDAAFIDGYDTWCIVAGDVHYVKYVDGNNWDKRENHFGQIDNAFENVEMIDAAYVDQEGRLFLFCNEQYARYSEVDFTLGTENATQPTMDAGYPKSIAEDWNDENQPIQLPEGFHRDLGPLFDGLDDHSYAFLGNAFVSSEDGEVYPVAEKWGRSEYDFGHVDHIDAAMASGGDYLLFLDDKVVKYRGSIELADLQPEEGYPKPIHEEFPALPAKFTAGISAALDGLDGKTYLFHDDDCAIIELEDGETTVTETRTNEKWGLIDNPIADSGAVDAAFVGLDGRTYLFSGARYTRYSGSDYTQVDDGFPRDIAEDWEGLTSVTAAFVLGNKTYLFGAGEDGANLYVRYSTLHVEEDDYLEVDEEDPNARVIEVKLANRPDVDEIEVFPAPVDAEFWSLPDSLTGGAEDFQIDAIMNGPEGKVYLFAGGKYIEHDHAGRWWSEPKTLSDQWDRVPEGLGNTKAAFTGKDGRTYLFYLDARDERNKFLRFSDPELYNLDNGYPRPTSRYWGRVRNNIEETGRVDAALVVESRWEEQDKNGQLVDYVEDHTYLFSGDQLFRYKGADYSKVEQGYPRAISRIKEEPRFRGLEVDFPDGIDAAFADQRQIYLFRGDTFHVVIGDEDNYKQYEDSKFADVAAVTQEEGVTYVLGSEEGADWVKLNHLEARALIETPATPRAAEKAEGSLTGAISAILHGADRNTYVFAGSHYYDVSLERVFAINEVFGRSTNPIHDQETIDAAFVGRDGVTYVFSGEWFVQYDTDTYMDKTVTYPPRRIRDKWPGLTNVALAYVWKEETYLFERPDADGHFHYLRYSRDSYEQPDSGYPRAGEHDFWQIPQAYLQEGFDQVDAIFVQEDNLIFISDQKFINFNLDKGTWGYPRELDLIYQGIPFNKTDFKDLKSGFVGADGKVYFFSDQTYVVYDEESGWSGVANIEDDWGLQTNIFDKGVDAAYVSPDGVTYLFAGNEYVRYSGRNYRYVDESYPKEIATYLLDEPAFRFMTKEFQQHLDAMEADNHTPFFDGIVDNGRRLYFFSRDTLFTGAPNKYAAYGIEGLGHVENNFTNGGYVDAAFVDTDNDKTYLFSGEQYIRYAGDDYRYMEAGYPKIIAEDLAGELGVASITENYRDGIDAAFYLSHLGVVFFNDRNYLNIQSGNSAAGDIDDVWGKLDNAFHSADKRIDGAYVDDEGRLHVFKGQQFARYSDSSELLARNPYDEARYVDEEYPQAITDQWPQLPASILTEGGIGAVFRFEDEIHFHTGGNFVAYEVDLSDHDEEVPAQVLAYRWGEWSDYLLSDVHALSRFKDLGQKFTGGNITLTEFVSGAKGKVEEPYMEFAAIFGFDKEDVRWVRQRNAFLPSKINVLEEDFDLELVLRLYDILATTRRLRVDVSSLYNDVWSKLYGATPDYKAAAEGAYDLLVQVDCNNNYETLVDQITDELNVIKRDALAPYVIANDDDITTTRALYQKLLIDIQMASCAKTSRIKEAIGAVQLYLHRYFINLEDVDLDASDQQAARETLKERWKWLRNYRVWEANRKVFLYPENYIRPELRDPDAISPAFRALQEGLSQGELTEDTVKAAYFKYLDAYSEVSELTIAGGYVYNDDKDGDGEDDKVLVLFGRTRADPMRYFYRFATFVGGSSTDITWEPWKELKIKIESRRVEPVFAFDRVFVFWPVLQEVASSDSEEASATESGSTTTIDSTDKIEYRIKVYYSFYNLNKEWSQPQLLNTEFNGAEELLIGDGKISEEDIKLFVENSSKLDNYDSEYENIYIRVRYTTVGDVTVDGVTTQKSTTNYKAFNLMPERYSQRATVQAIENSLDGPWFAYNHNGSGFLVKPDARSIGSGLWPKSISGSGMPSANITAAAQAKNGDDVYFFLDDKTYVSSSNLSAAADINSRWGMQSTTGIQITGKVDSAFVRSGSAYLTLDDHLYAYNGSDMDLMVKAPYGLSTVIAELPSDWTEVDAAFTTSGGVSFWFNTDSGSVLQSDTGNISTIRSRFGLPHPSMSPIGAAHYALVYGGALHVIHNGAYTVYDNGGNGIPKGPATVGAVLDGLFGKVVPGINDPGNMVNGLMVVNGGVWIRSPLHLQFVNSSGMLDGAEPGFFGPGWRAGVEYGSGGKIHRIVCYSNKTADAWTDGALVSNAFATNVDVTAAFTSQDGKRVMIITDDTTCHLFSYTQGPMEILAQLKSGANSVSLAKLDVDVYLGTGMQSNNIWVDNAVDAAIIGSSSLGAEGKLYLFSGSQYFRFTPDGDGEYPATADDGYPRAISGNSEIDSFPSYWHQVDAAFTGPSDNVSYLFNNSAREFYRSDTKATAATAEQWGIYASTDLMVNQVVDAAYSAGGYLYLIAGDEVYRYTLKEDGSIPTYIDSGYPKDMPNGVSVDAAFALGDYIYFFSGSSYYRLKTSSTTDPATLSGASPISGSWGNIPSDIRASGLSAAYNVTDSDGVETLYFIQHSDAGNYYLDYAISTDGSADDQPYEFDEVNYEVIRLTSSTAERFNRILFAGEIADLLQMSTQECNESPTISTRDSAPDNIQMNSDRFAADKEPINSHLDFFSANGLYYWEIFFHAPFLIAQTLNEDQKFEDAKEWFEYIYDPTEVADYWKFLPFLATDPDALMATLRDDLDNFQALTSAATVQDARDALDGAEANEAGGLADKLSPYQDVFLGRISKKTYEADLADSARLANIENWTTYKAMATAVGNLDTSAGATSADDALLKTWQGEMQEVLEIICKLDYRIDLMDNYSAQLAEHLADPFDPHAIAALRPLAYRKAIVMRYVDNLLDWGDMLFRQYTRESINEARMRYILAYDLLGEKPENLGEVVLEKAKAYEELTHDKGAGKYDFLIDLEDELGASVTDYSENLSFGATQYDTVANPYFYLEENERFTEYWDRVQDRLDKIRNCLNIDGIAQPLPLFQPPIDPMALVNAAASGGIAAAMAAAAGGATVPDYRFDVLLGKARELTGRLKNLGDNLLSTLEKKDSEALSLLQNKQEAAMLALATRLKAQQIEEAETSLENIQESLARAREQESHYKCLISAGMLREEETQIGMMGAAAAIHGLTALGKIVSGLSYVVPQITAGAFSFGVTHGGQHIGGMLDKFAEAVEPIAQGLEMGGEVAGIVAQYKRSREDWQLQEKMAASEVKQLGFEIAAQRIRIQMAQHELASHERDIENNQAIEAFMKGKFTNEQLYNWMSGRISGIFFQTYKMAHDYARQAEQAFIFEKGIEAGEVNYVRGAYWDSQRKGLLAGATLDLDLDRMDKAYMESDRRGLEITRNISLLEIDPLALLQLKTRGSCNFRLTEELFDYDFPGHYNRQIKTISLAFDIGEGQAVNATLTQLNSKQVLAPDIEAVKHLIDPANEANTNVRVNWRANQQVALSHTDQYTENNGMFELNFRDERYLPFEGTGAVSSWRLELNGTKGAYNPADLLDVTIRLRYSASQGGQRFATEVKGVLKPYNATSFFDMAYNFPDEWTALTQGDAEDVTIRFTRDMFPNMSSSRIIGLFIRYQYDKGESGAIFTIEDDLQAPNNTYLQPATLSVGQEGVDWMFALKGDRSTLKNAEMVLVYKAKL